MFGLFDRKGLLISTCSETKLSDTDAYIFNFMTHENYRGQGYGSVVWKLTLQSLGDRNIILHAAEGTPPMYKTYGLVVVDDAVVFYYEARLKDNQTPAEIEEVSEQTVETVNKDTIDSVYTYEKGVSNLDRKVMFSQMLSQDESCCFRAVGADGVVLGYALAEVKGKVLIVASLCANDLPTAQSIVRAVMDDLGKKCETVALHGLEPNSASLAELLRPYVQEELKHAYTVYDMATARIPPIQWKKVYAFGFHPWCTTH